jgi:hypothetical protein
MIVFGICLLIIAAIVSKLDVLWGIGMIVLIVGVHLLVPVGRGVHSVVDAMTTNSLCTGIVIRLSR